MISISRDFLSDSLPSSPRTVQSLQLVELHLAAIIQHTQSSKSLLPDWEYLLPNQHTRTQTTEQIGANFCKRPWLTNPSSTPLATEQIELLNQKQPCAKNADPYRAVSGLARMLLQMPRQLPRTPRHRPMMLQVSLLPNGAANALAPLCFPCLWHLSCRHPPLSPLPLLHPPSSCLPPLHGTQHSLLITQVHSHTHWSLYFGLMAIYLSPSLTTYPPNRITT